MSDIEARTKKHVIITTTVHIPYNLDAYAADIALHGPDGSEIVIAADKKTPSGAAEFLQKLQANFPTVKITYLTCEMQDDFLAQWPLYKDFLPWNCIQRRNVAILYAYHVLKADVIVTIDDDNYFDAAGSGGGAYLAQHGRLGEPQNLVTVSSDSGWLNVCYGFLMGNFYPRGYSFKFRGESDRKSTVTRLQKPIEGRIVVNGGLWEGDPDIDAVTRLANRPESIAMGYERIVLANGRETITLKAPREVGIQLQSTKCPFNSQNTALHRDVIPAYCMATGLGRYDDIIASYIVKRIADHLGDYISFGKPIVTQTRNAHNLFQDLKEEMVGMQVVDDFVEWLWSVELTGANYLECMKELLDKGFGINRVLEDKEASDFFSSLCVNYRFWVGCFE